MTILYYLSLWIKSAWINYLEAPNNQVSDTFPDHADYFEFQALHQRVPFLLYIIICAIADGPISTHQL